MSGIIRVFDKGKKYGDQYIWVATCRFIDLKTIEVLGVTTPPNKEQWRAVLQACSLQGIDTVFYLRHKHGKIERHKRSTNKNKSLKIDIISK